ncbi:MAG: hypothetical protein EOM91_06455 [Sphingobacteriia bacterium]|nr:hypothetical protein [Sphingobacteriia bacterium]NCC39057.1 hypothetical protein [Gammaproteobacteria bacterium]
MHRIAGTLFRSMSVGCWGSFVTPTYADQCPWVVGVPSSPQPTRLKVLSQDEDGFFLMAEQGDIDWANHANDFARMVGTVKNLHEGVQAVVDFVNQPNDQIDWTNRLLIVTSDHSNNYMRNVLALDAGDLPMQIAKPAGSPQTPSCFVANCFPDGEVTFASGGHTNELTRVYAMGAGMDLFRRYEGRWYPGTKILDNTQLFQVMMEAAGLPQESRMQISRTPR